MKICRQLDGNMATDYAVCLSEMSQIDKNIFGEVLKDSFLEAHPTAQA
jgi:hypothetical protein